VAGRAEHQRFLTTLSACQPKPGARQNSRLALTDRWRSSIAESARSTSLPTAAALPDAITRYG
jgi:hypothetical protein